MIKLGLIGKNIQSSQAPDIHKRLGKLFNISLSYQIFDLNENNKIDFSDQLIPVSYTHLTLPTKDSV